MLTRKNSLEEEKMSETVSTNFIHNIIEKDLENHKVLWHLDGADNGRRGL